MPNTVPFLSCTIMCLFFFKCLFQEQGLNDGFKGKQNNVIHKGIGIFIACSLKETKIFRQVEIDQSELMSAQ